ncbi:FAD binding domain-containing protein [Pisolithus thermaeus]|nr:FAD binding domain-containing protein [Pisolithus croceorrhizus]KAI6169184.1 FAD binding domain-containing protein [Pisolithus thermaeus]
MTARTPPVLVVGAGPTGLAAALTLARNNVPVRIIEKEPQHRCGQRGVGIQPRTFEVFHFLRVPEIHERATPIPLIQEHNKGSLEPLNTFAAMDYMEPTPAIPYYNIKLMGQPTLEAIIREHLAKLGCTVELGTQLISFSQDERCVRAKVVKYRSDSGGEVEEDIEAAYLIGADGAKGMTRKQLGLTFLGTTLENSHMELGDIRLEVEGLDRDARVHYFAGGKTEVADSPSQHWHIFLQTSQSRISLRPTNELGKDGWQFVIVNPVVDAQDLTQDEAALVDRIKDFVGLGDDVKVKEVMWASAFRPNIRMVNKFGVGRAFVAGGMDTMYFSLMPDAAHVHSPAGGQGLNSGIQDAFNIAWKIAFVYKELSSAPLLDTYTTERLPVIAEMLGLTTQIHKQMFGESGSEHTPQSIADRNGNPMNIGSNLERGMRRGKNVYMLGVNYRSSPIVVDEFAPTSEASVAHSAYGEIQEGILQAGDRAPDAPGLVSVITHNCAPHLVSSGSYSAVSLPGGVVGSTRMFDIFTSTHHTVIIFAPTLVVPVVQSILKTLQEVVSKELVQRVVVLPGSHPELGGHVESRTSSGAGETADVELLVDQVGHAYRGYVVEEGEIKIVVVRPDGVVGAIVRGVAGLEQYFEGVFGKRGGVVDMEDAVQV